MEGKAVGKVLVTALIENLEDLSDARRERLPAEQVRRVEVHDALVDSGATGLLLPRRMIAALGLTPLRTQTTRTAAGQIQIPIYRAVRLTIQGRDCISDVGELADELPVIIGQIPLETMDWVIDLRGQRLIGNPDHGGVQMMEAL